MEKGIIAIIDYEDEFKDDFSETLKNFDLSDKYELRLVKNFKRSMPKEQIARQCASEMQEFKKSLVAIMIDIVLFETTTKRETIREVDVDLTGIKIVKDIRIDFPNLPIFLVTKHIQAPKEKAFQFLPIVVFGSLEDVDGVLIKQYLLNAPEYTGILPFRKSDFEEIIDKARGKRNAYSTGSILLLSKEFEEKSFEELKEIFRPDGRSALQIKEIGSTVFKHLIAELFPRERGTISYFRPGFSGSYLFKVDIDSDDNTSWILKLDETQKIERELNNYKQVEKFIDRENYPYPVKECVNYGKWGTFAVKRESATITLFDYLNLPQLHEISNVTSKVASILKKLYGDHNKISSHLWQEHYAFSTKNYLRLRTFLDSQETILKKHCGKDKVNVIEAFVNSEGKSEKKIYEKVHWIYIGKIHGDFNSRNILLTPDLSQTVLIDYAKYGDGHIVKDISKLEADSIFFVLDGKSDKFYDWNRINDWNILFDLLKIDNVFNFKDRTNIDDFEIKLTYDFVRDLRRVLKEIIFPLVEPVEYLKSLLYYSFHYLIYPDISIQKKVFAIEWIYQLITQLKNADVNLK